MTASETNGGDEGLASSPKNKVKFLCSYGGKILPRPGDGKLKYVGGETRMVAVPGDIKFSELMEKVNSMVEGDMVLKFLVIPDELDALVTVKSDEDVKCIVDEYRRLESEGTPKMRAFLFPSNPVVVERPMSPVDPYAIEQRYIEAINGIVRPRSNNTSGRLTPVNRLSNFSISACTSPKSPSPDATPFPMDGLYGNQLSRSRAPMHKVRSSPSLYSLGTHKPQNNNHSNHQVYQPHHHYHQNHHQQQRHHNVQSARTSPGPPDFVRGAMGHGHVPMNRVYSSSRHNLGNGYTACTCCHDDNSAYASAGSSRRSSLSTSGRLDKSDSPSRRIFMLE